MPLFAWKGKNRYGDAVNGERIASSSEDLTRILQKEFVSLSRPF